MNPENLDDSLMDASCDSTLTQLGAGAQIGRYRIERSLGAGGMGEVFRAHDTRLDDEIFTPAPWMWDNLYEIIANVEPGATSAQVQSMLQKLLADRFGLRVHHETQKLFGSEVVIAKDGAKLQANQNPSLTRLPMVRDHAPNTGRFPEVPEGHAGIAMHYQQDGRVYLTAVAQSVSDLLGLSVFRYYHAVDRTGLGEQKYDFRLVFGVGLDLYGQMEKQLGLKVRSAEVSIDVLIIDKAEEMPRAS